MDDTGLSQISEELPVSELSVSELSVPELSVPELAAFPTTQDIPEAVREATGLSASALKPDPKRNLSRNPLLFSLAGLSVAALIAVPLTLAVRSFAPAPTAIPTSAESPPVADPTDADPANSSVDSDSADQALLGHLLYVEAPKTELEPVTPDGGIMMRRTAAEQFKAMLEAAAADGILLVPLSGFRSVAEQESVFFDVKAERGEGATKRATVSAPPGYSEHHTGYAIDIGDGDHPGADLQFDFEETAAFKWLKENAAYYSFEMSFPKDNPMGVTYEPWHWRFVGDRQSLETFYRAKNREASSAAETPAETPTPSPEAAGADTLE